MAGPVATQGPPAPSGPNGLYTWVDLYNLWIYVGGDPNAAGIAAAIALAESGGNPNASHTNANGTTDVGLWQINSSHGSAATTDPVGNARAAVAIYQGGHCYGSTSGNNFSCWTTAYDNPQRPSPGTYAPSGNSPAGNAYAKAFGQQPNQAASQLGSAQPESLPETVAKIVGGAVWHGLFGNIEPGQLAIRALEVVGGGLLMLGGLTLIVFVIAQQPVARVPSRMLRSAAGRGSGTPPRTDELAARRTQQREATAARQRYARGTHGTIVDADTAAATREGRLMPGESYL
jgi:hypothetical protein